MNADLGGLIQQTTKIPKKTFYWFVRTDDGQYFDTFLNNNFIAIGWNEITLFELRDLNKYEEVIRQKLIISGDLDPEGKNTKGKVTSIINKLITFNNLKKGDVIVIPSKNSTRLAFGMIKNSFTIISDTNDDCKFLKRKEVEWKEVKLLNDLDNIFYKIKSNRHSISNINAFGPYIDKVINTLYIKDESIHYVIDLKTQEDINVISLINLIDGIQDLIIEINKDFVLNERVEENAIKLNLQSPGSIQFKLPSGKAMIILAMALSTASCLDPSVEASETVKAIPQEIHHFVEKNRRIMDTISSSLDDLEADRKKINSF